MTRRPCEVDPSAHPHNRIGTHPPRTRAWRDGRVVAEGFPVADLAGRLADADTVVWVDLCGPGREGLQVLGDELGLHGLAVEDAATRQERTKLDRYDGYLFLNAYAAGLRAGRLELHEVSAFLTGRALITVRHDTGFDVDALIARWDEAAPPDGHGVTYLLYGLLDLLVDGHLATVMALDEQTGDLEELVFDESASVRDIQQRSFLLRKNLLRLRRAMLPMEGIVATLMRRDLELVPPQLRPYFHDVYDHAVHAAERADSVRELIADLLETRLALQSNRLNEVMKKITSWAAIVAVPTAVTGFYGQNVPYPGYLELSGFITSSLIMIAVSVVLYVMFKWRDWL
ncbi:MULTISPECIES: magnesium transporter CorA family protein [Thermomonospora]|uniref:Mg2 transporter protein CorA family protein n=1 Tax=Thermomonospora curvata (strain ATCC 19995 / DSM 43183 / JCM 3096 / KCTC 9072 / NBRC 15933 / NCIMB 10081 / Henssen B9) TaxID=471852 RepID=D1A7G7_THECD|nr:MULTISPECIES: magnesium transporter CorA family protein [Thermomonospora]ACY96556.1 Mg2 transporter protein CorA family protein [Thermomonospora curvata DSM 43183]PKK15369.1 MAG: magnesium transporter [Thermomonospora sp. CIF 1]